MLRSIFLVLLALSRPIESRAADKLMAVAIRYLQVTGVSHSHIYLYDWDGQLIRRLTNSAIGQDVEPVFSPNGREIVFTRHHKTSDEWWTVGTLGHDAHQITQPQEWYAKVHANAPRFVLFNLEWERYFEREAPSGPEATPAPTPDETPKPERIVAPDSSVEIVLTRTGDETRDYDNQELGELYRIRNLETGEESLLGSWKNFETMWDPLHLRGEDSHFFLIEPPLRTVFFFRHLNSTDGDRTYALDFRGKRVVPLSSNDARPFRFPARHTFSR